NPDDQEGRPAPQGAGRGAAESSVARRARPRVARATGPRRRSADGQAGLLRPRRLVRTEVVDVAIDGPRMVRLDQVMAGRPVADPAAAEAATGRAGSGDQARADGGPLPECFGHSIPPLRGGRARVPSSEGLTDSARPVFEPTA